MSAYPEIPYFGLDFEEKHAYYPQRRKHSADMRWIASLARRSGSGLER